MSLAEIANVSKGTSVPPTQHHQFTLKQLELIKEMALYYTEGQDEELQAVVAVCDKELSA
jgi:hypothetical protein